MADPKPYYRTLEIRDFTCFHEARFDFGPGINVFVGENGVGKTHVLKLLYAVQTSKTDSANQSPKLSTIFNVSKVSLLVRTPNSSSVFAETYGEVNW